MSSTIYTRISGATQHPLEMFGVLDAKLIKSSGVAFREDNYFLVEQSDVPAMSVDIRQGYAWIVNSINSIAYPVRLADEDATVTITANASGNSRIDAVICYINTATSPNTTATNIATLAVIAGTPAASPVAPTDAEIATSIGASNPFLRLANVTVASGATSIVNANILDQRADIGLVSPIGGALAGWRAVPHTEIWTYASADAPTYTFTISGDYSTKYYAGMKIRFTQTVDGVKYAFITKVAYSTGTTTITIYCGTDYDLDNAAIYTKYYSTDKAPAGFPMDRAKWTQTLTDSTQRTQATPTQNTWYNAGSLSIDVPIGLWNVFMNVAMGSNDTTATVLNVSATLSTANNTESNTEYTVDSYYQGASGTLEVAGSYFRQFPLNLAAKTTYYVNIRTEQSGIANIYLWNATSVMYIKFVCAYL